MTPDVVSDVIVVLPGVLGSTLVKDDVPIWAPTPSAAFKALLTLGGSLRELALPVGIGDAHPNDGVVAAKLVPDLHVVPGVWSANIGYGVLLSWLHSRFGLTEASADDPNRLTNLLAVPYDWRLSNRYNGRQLKGIVEPALERWRSQGGPFSDAKLVFVCHSMGGLVARWYIEREGGAEVTRKLVTLGTPYRGALNALDQLVNGVRKGIGPLRFDLVEFARTLPSLYQLLPEYACIETPGGLAKTTEVELPQLARDLVADGMLFHEQIDDAAAHPAHPYDVHPIVGTRQRTWTSAKVTGDTVSPIWMIDEVDEGGDATVPRLSATPRALAPDSPAIRWVAEKHGSLQSNRAIFDELDGVLTARPVIHRALPEIELAVALDELLVTTEPVTVAAVPVPGEAIALRVLVRDEAGRTVESAQLTRTRDGHRVELPPLPPGAYVVTVSAVPPLDLRVAPVTSPLLVLESAGGIA